MPSSSNPKASAPHVRVRGPLIAASRGAILKQTERLLESSLFRQSRRYRDVLRYLVEQALDGKGEPELKERTIGVEVLGRGGDYDTAADASVRVVAGEIRKRLALYYQQPGHESEIRIDLPAGSYQPEFSMPGEWQELPSARAQWKRRAFYGALSLLTVGAVTFAWLTVHPFEGALASFWYPVFKDSEPVLVCIGERPQLGAFDAFPPHAAADGPSPRTMADFLDHNPVLIFSDVLATNRIADFLRSKEIAYRMRTSTTTDLGSLREGPAILIGSYNNAWSDRLNADKRFRFRAPSADGLVVLEDRQNPARQDWSMRLTASYSDVTADYGLITRAFESTTGHTVVTIGGFSGLATEAAAEFAVSPAGMKMLASRAPGGWKTQNLEVVIEAKLINGTAAPPRIVATHFW
jgi:hypothetical protein